MNRASETRGGRVPVISPETRVPGSSMPGGSGSSVAGDVPEGNSHRFHKLLAYLTLPSASSAGGGGIDQQTHLEGASQDVYDL